MCTMRNNGAAQWIVWAAKEPGTLDLSSLGGGALVVDRLLGIETLQASGADSIPVGNAPMMIRRN